MSRKDEKRTRKGPKRKRAASSRAPAQGRPGLPKPESVVAEKTFVSPKGRTYRILTTTETDPYDPPVPGKKPKP